MGGCTLIFSVTYSNSLQPKLLCSSLRGFQSMKLLIADENINNPRLHLRHYKESSSIMGKCFLLLGPIKLIIFIKNCIPTKSNRSVSPYPKKTEMKGQSQTPTCIQGRQRWTCSRWEDGNRMDTPFRLASHQLPSLWITKIKCNHLRSPGKAQHDHRNPTAAHSFFWGCAPCSRNWELVSCHSCFRPATPI